MREFSEQILLTTQYHGRVNMIKIWKVCLLGGGAMRCPWQGKEGGAFSRWQCALLATCSLLPRPDCLFLFLRLFLTSPTMLDNLAPAAFKKSQQFKLWKNWQRGEDCKRTKTRGRPPATKGKNVTAANFSPNRKIELLKLIFFLQVLHCIVKHNSPYSKRVWVAK